MSAATISAPVGSTTDLRYREVGDLVRAAARRQEGAWDALVQRFEGLVRGIARTHGLGEADIADVSQVVWMRLVDHLNRIREPERVAGWLATTTRHECLRTLRHQGRTTPTADPSVLESVDQASDLGATLGATQRDAVLYQLIETLPYHHRELLRVTMADPKPSYREAATTLGIPVGSVGPTRQRCLALLRTKCAAAGIEP